MKKSLIAITIAATAAFSLSSAFADEGTVHFTGEILDQACTVDIGANAEMTVNLGRVAKTAFNGAGTTPASATLFNIVLKDCPATVSSAKVKFAGNPDGTDSNLLAIDEVSGAASGVAIKLMTADRTALGLHQVNDYSYPLVSTAPNTLPFYATYIATDDTVTAGPANSDATFTVNYN